MPQLIANHNVFNKVYEVFFCIPDKKYSSFDRCPEANWEKTLHMKISSVTQPKGMTKFVYGFLDSPFFINISVRFHSVKFLSQAGEGNNSRRSSCLRLAEHKSQLWNVEINIHYNENPQAIFGHFRAQAPDDFR